MLLLASSGACVLVLHILRPDLQPSGHRLSEYANGSFGYLMTAAFMAMGLGLLALAYAMTDKTESRWWLRIVPLVIAAAGIGMILSAIFPTEPDGTDTMTELIHSRASGSATIALIVAATLWSIVRRDHRSNGRPEATVLAVLVVIIGCLNPLWHESAWKGLSQRLLWLVLIGWLLITARQLGRWETAAAAVPRPPQALLEKRRRGPNMTE